MAKPIEDLPGEIWKPVVGWESVYMVSNMGRVKSLARTRAGKNGTRIGVSEKIMNPSPNTYGHVMVRLSCDGRRTRRFAHHLVMEAFVGPRPEGMECCHNNGNPGDNRLRNLRWDTPSANWDDRRRHGRGTEGEKHPNATLSRADVRAIRRQYIPGRKGNASLLAERYGICTAGIIAAARKKTWRHI